MHLQAQELRLRKVMELAGDLCQSVLHTVDSASFLNSTPLLYPLLYTRTHTPHSLPLRMEDKKWSNNLAPYLEKKDRNPG